MSVITRAKKKRAPERDSARDADAFSPIEDIEGGANALLETVSENNNENAIASGSVPTEYEMLLMKMELMKLENENLQLKLKVAEATATAQTKDENPNEKHLGSETPMKTTSIMSTISDMFKKNEDQKLPSMKLPPMMKQDTTNTETNLNDTSPYLSSEDDSANSSDTDSEG